MDGRTDRSWRVVARGFRMMLAAAAITGGALPAAGVADDAGQAAGTGDPWAPFRDLVGAWHGESNGFGGVSDVTHEWGFAVRDTFLRLRTRSVARSGDESGEVHEDVGYLSRDTDSGTFVFRQFLSEGFVNTYDVTREGDVIRFDFREAESAGDMRARMRLTFRGRLDYDMVLDLSGPDGVWAACQTMSLARVESGPD